MMGRSGVRYGGDRSPSDTEKRELCPVRPTHPHFRRERVISATFGLGVVHRSLGEVVMSLSSWRGCGFEGLRRALGSAHEPSRGCSARGSAHWHVHVWGQ